MTSHVQRRNNVHTAGDGPATLFFAHGFGCDQNMWRLLEPEYRKRYRTVLFDLVGSGDSDLQAFDFAKYATLDGYAADVAEIVREFGQGPAIFVGHSVSTMIGVLADLAHPGLIAAHAMVGPSPCYINDTSTWADSSAPTLTRCSKPWKATTLAGRARWRQQ